jgi:hypothetical protein
MVDTGVRVMVFNATFNNISVISWWSVLLVEETGVPGENYWPSQSKKCISITKKSDTSITVIYHAMSLTVLYQYH